MRRAWVLLLIAGLATGARADDARLHNTAANAYLWDHKDKQAFDEFVLSLKADPRQAMPHFQLGRLFEKQGQFDEALKQYQDCLAVQPTYPGAEDGVKRLGYLVAPRPTGAANAAAADVLATGDLARQFATAREMTTLRRFAEAEKVCAAILEKKPGDPAVCVLLAQDLEGQGRIGEALQWYRQAQKKVPQNVQLELAISKLLYAQGDFGPALEEARTALSLDAKNPLVFKTIGEILLAANRKAEAYQYLAEAARLNPGDALSKFKADTLVKDLGLRHYNSGMYYWQTGQWRLAVEELEAALKNEFGNMAPEDRSRLQSALIDARFMMEEVGKKIAEIQKERNAREFGFLDKRLAFDDVINNATFWREGRTVDFSGFLVAREDGPIGSDLIVSVDKNDLFVSDESSDIGRRRDSTEVLANFQGSGPNGANVARGFGFRANTQMLRWFVCHTPKLLPTDERIRPSSTVRVLGKLARPQFIQNPYNHTFSRQAQPVVYASQVEFRRESPIPEPAVANSGSIGQGATRGAGSFDTSSFPITSDVNTPPGVAGPLKIDYLTIDEPATARPLPGTSVPLPGPGRTVAVPPGLPGPPPILPPPPIEAPPNEAPSQPVSTFGPASAPGGVEPGDPLTARERRAYEVGNTDNRR